MNTFSLKVKIFSFAVIVSMLLVFVGSVGIYSLRSVTRNYEKIAAEYQEYKKTLNSIHFDARRLMALASLAGARGITPEKMSEYKSKYDEVAFVFDSTVNLIQNNLRTDQDKQDFEAISGAWQTFGRAAADVFNLALSPNPEDQARVAKALHEELFPSGSIVEEKVTALAERESALEEIEFKQIGSTAYMGSMVGGIFAGLGLFLTMSFGFVFSRSLASNLSKSVNSLTEVSGALTEANKKVLNSSESLASSTREQEASLEKTASSIQEMKAMVGGNTLNAEKSRDVSAMSFDAASTGKRTVDAVVLAIDEISNSNQEIVESLSETAEEIHGFVKMVNEISLKTKIINSIVFQTKLLSFNASVEAAQAGEHGKGFSVVAQEIGNLAKMSGKASIDINKILTESTFKAVEMAENMKSKIDAIILKGNEKIENGMAVAKTCDAALEEIVHNSTEVRNMAGDIASSSKDQEAGITMIEDTILQLKAAATQNAASSEETSSASQSLQVQVNEINAMVYGLTGFIYGKNRKSRAKKTDSSDEPKLKDESALENRSDNKVA